MKANREVNTTNNTRAPRETVVSDGKTDERTYGYPDGRTKDAGVRLSQVVLCIEKEKPAKTYIYIMYTACTRDFVIVENVRLVCLLD